MLSLVGEMLASDALCTCFRAQAGCFSAELRCLWRRSSRRARGGPPPVLPRFVSCFFVWFVVGRFASCRQDHGLDFLWSQSFEEFELLKRSSGKLHRRLPLPEEMSSTYAVRGATSFDSSSVGLHVGSEAGDFPDVISAVLRVTAEFITTYALSLTIECFPLPLRLCGPLSVVPAALAHLGKTGGARSYVRVKATSTGATQGPFIPWSLHRQ